MGIQALQGEVRSTRLVEDGANATGSQRPPRLAVFADCPHPYQCVTTLKAVQLAVVVHREAQPDNHGNIGGMQEPSQNGPNDWPIHVCQPTVGVSFTLPDHYVTVCHAFQRPQVGHAIQRVAAESTCMR